MPSRRRKGSRDRSPTQGHERHVSKDILAKRPKRIPTNIYDRAAKMRRESLGENYATKSARLNQARLEWSRGIYRATMNLKESKQKRVSTVMREKIDAQVSERYQVAKWKWSKDKKGRKVQVPTLWLNTKTKRYAGKKAIAQSRRRAREKYENELLKRVYKLSDRDVKKLGKTPVMRRALMVEIYKGPGGS